jgi:hypothetical protein
MQDVTKEKSELATASHVDLYVDLLKRCLTASLYDESSWRVIEGTISPEDRSIRRPRRFRWGHMRRLGVGILRRKSLTLVRREPFDPAARDGGEDHPCLFGFTMIGNRRLDNIKKCVEDVLEHDVPGDLIETGVWRGGSTIFMRALLKLHGVTDRVVWVADSFEGLPKPASSDDGWDISYVDYMSASLEQVKSNFERFGLLDDQVRFLKGWFCDTMPSAPIERLAILRLDGDLYTSTMDVLRNLYHRVSPGGYVIVDDYYSWESCRQAVSDFLRDTGIEPRIQQIDKGGAFWKVEVS